MEYYLCQFEYGYSGLFYQVVENGNVIKYVDLDGNELVLEGSYGYGLLSHEAIIPSWA